MVMTERKNMISRRRFVSLAGTTGQLKPLDMHMHQDRIPQEDYAVLSLSHVCMG